MAVIEINWRPDARVLRQFAAMWLVCFSLIGLLVAYKSDAWQSPGWHGGWIAPAVLWTLAAVIGSAGLAFPRLINPVYLAWMAAAFPIGWLVSHLVLGVLFYGLFTPFALVFRLIGRDLLQRKFAPRAESYWVRRQSVDDVKRYLRQF